MNDAVSPPVRVALAGAGQFGVTLAAAIRSSVDVTLVAVADQNRERAEHVLRLANALPILSGIETLADATRHVAQHRPVAVTDMSWLAALDVDVVVEATGHPHAGAALARDAIANARHVVMVSKEVESVVGPILAAKARAVGVVYTMVEGDQPGLLVTLIERARRMGLRIVAAGKATEYDFVYSPGEQQLQSQGVVVSAPQLAQHWHLAEDINATLSARAAIAADFSGRTASDLCEMLLVANATAMAPSSETLHAPLLRTLEVPEVFRARADGGVLAAAETLSVFQCLRRDDEAGFAGGVFVVVQWPPGETGCVLAGKGMPTSSDGRFGLLHNPVHLLGVECVISILDAATRGQPTAQAHHPMVDLVAIAARDFAPGEVLTMGGHFHEIDGASARLRPSASLQLAHPLPYYLAANATLATPVLAGEAVCLRHVVPCWESALWQLRVEQDAMFGADPRRCR